MHDESTTKIKRGRRRLPPSCNLWAHAVNSQEKLRAALENKTGSNNSEGYCCAIEADVSMGQLLEWSSDHEDTTSSTTQAAITIVPIMAHPPQSTSDLSMQDFLDQVSEPNPIMTKNNNKNINNDGNNRILKQIIKLDFKDMEAVEPTLQAIQSKRIVTTATNKESNNIFFLNADILPGPGNRKPEDVSNKCCMDPAVFIPTVLEYIQAQIKHTGQTNIAWSLGYKTCYESRDEFARSDFESMDGIIKQYNLLGGTEQQGIGVVICVSARQLAKCLDLVSSNFMAGGIWERTTPDELQLLVWTGRTELPLRQSTLDAIKAHFCARKLLDRLSLDVKVGGNYGAGLALDVGIRFSQGFSLAKAKLCSRNMR